MFALYKRGPTPSSSTGTSSTVSSRGLKRLLLVDKFMSVTVIPSAFKKNQPPPLVSSPRRPSDTQASSVPKRDPFVFPLNSTVRNPRVPAPKPQRLPVSKARISEPIRLAKTAQKSSPAVSRIPRPSRGTVYSVDITVTSKVKSLKEFSLRSKIPVAISPRPGFASPPSQSTHLKMRAIDPFAASPAVGCTVHWPPRSPRRPRAVPSDVARSRYNQKLTSEGQTPCPSQTLVVEARHNARKVSAAAAGNSSGSCLGKEGRVLCTKETAIDTVVPLTTSDLVCSESVMRTVFHLLLNGIEEKAPGSGLSPLGPAENAGDLKGSDSDATTVSGSGNSDSVFGRPAPPDPCTINKSETKMRTKKPKVKENSTGMSMGGLIGKMRKRLSRKSTSSVSQTSSFVSVEQSGWACLPSKDNDKPCKVHQVLARHHEVVIGASYQFDTQVPPPPTNPRSRPRMHNSIP